MTGRRPRRGAGTVRRSAAALVGGLLATIITAAGLVGTPAAAYASAQPIGDCTTGSGVILAVDFSHWGGPILRSCGTTPTTGYDLLNQGGWRTAGDNHDGPAFICRIGYSGYHGGTEYPTANQDPCIVTPPASAYWSYWHANPGQNTWSYSQLGAMSYHPRPGSVDLWIFGGTNIAGTEGVPTFSPNSVRANNTSPIGGGPTKRPTPTPTHTTMTSAPTPMGTQSTSTAASGPAATSRTSTARAGATGALMAGTSPSPRCDPSPPPSSPQMSPSPSVSARPPDPTAGPSGSPPPAPSSSLSPPPCILNAPPAAANHVSHGSTTPAIIALVIVVLLGVGGVIAVLRRPRRDQ